MNAVRRGFSLFEVMIAMALFVTGLALILGMLGTSEAISRRARDTLNAQIICQNKLNQIVLGFEDWVNVATEECEENPDFLFAVRSQPVAFLPLQQVEVSVWPKTPEEKAGRPRVSQGTDSTRPAGLVKLECFLPRDPDPIVDRLSGEGRVQ